MSPLDWSRHNNIMDTEPPVNVDAVATTFHSSNCLDSSVLHTMVGANPDAESPTPVDAVVATPPSRNRLDQTDTEWPSTVHAMATTSLLLAMTNNQVVEAASGSVVTMNDIGMDIELDSDAVGMEAENVLNNEEGIIVREEEDSNRTEEIVYRQDLTLMKNDI